MSIQSRPSLANVYLIDATAASAAALYTVAKRTPPPLIGIFIAIAPVVAIGLWVRNYLRRVQFAIPFDFGYFFFIGWPILIPIVAKRLPTPNPWRLAALMYTLALAPVLVAYVVEIVRYILA